MASNAALDAGSFSISSSDPAEDVAADERLKFATEFTNRLQRDGYVRLRNHGIDLASIEQTFQAVSLLWNINCFWGSHCSANHVSLAQGVFQATPRRKTTITLSRPGEPGSRLHSVPFGEDLSA